MKEPPSVYILKEKLRPLFQKAVNEFCFVNIDMESYHHKDLTLQVFKELVAEPEFQEGHRSHSLSPL